MFNELKKSLWPVIVIGISLLLLPTIASLFRINPDDDGILSLLLNSNFIQVIGLIFTFFPGSIYLIILLKEKRSEKILAKADRNDPIWDEDSLKLQTKATFYKIQGCLRNEDVTPIKGYATKEFIYWFKGILENKNEDKIATVDIDATETRIICCEDFLHNDKDRFVGYIKGNILQDEDSDGDDSPKKEFSEVYHFVRSKNEWLLNKIDGSSLWNLLRFASKYEVSNNN